jgi:predicted phosphoadenosine phosphosulfate sulfurtransferase
MDYQKIWKDRCYDELPDEIPTALAKTNRVPSWKAVALALLNNDLKLYTIGFAKSESQTSIELMRQKKDQQNKQPTLF